MKLSEGQYDDLLGEVAALVEFILNSDNDIAGYIDDIVEDVLDDWSVDGNLDEYEDEEDFTALLHSTVERVRNDRPFVIKVEVL